MKLTANEKALLETQFPAELEKEAAAEVAKIQELYSVGFEKMAAEAAEKMDEEEDSEEDKKEDKKELSKEQEKEASARAAFIARGYIDGLMKEGSERHGDELHYLYPAVAEKLGADAGKVKAFMQQLGAKASELGAKGKAHAQAAGAKAKEMAGKASEHVKAHKGAYGAGAGALALGGGALALHKKKKKEK